MKTLQEAGDFRSFKEGNQQEGERTMNPLRGTVNAVLCEGELQSHQRGLCFKM